LHYDVVASFVTPDGLQIPLLFHRIRARPNWGELKEDRWKQECERSAFPIVLKELKRLFPRLRMCIHLDALYATDANFTLLQELNMGYSIVRKAKVLKTVGEDCEGLEKFCPSVENHIEAGRFKIHQTIHFFNDIAYRGHKLSLVKLDESAEKKPSKRQAKVISKNSHWEWIIQQRLDSNNAREVATSSRIRWKQEEMFNDLQHHGFGICHDFNRAPTAQLIRTFLILIAYAITSILLHTKLGQAILTKRMTVTFMMERMFTDIIYIPAAILFNGKDPGQFRWATGPPIAFAC